MPQESTKVHPLEEFIKSESFATKVLNTSLNGLYVYDVKLGKNIFINAEYTRLTGYTLCELQAMDDTQFFARFHPEDTERVSDHIQKIVFNNVEVQEIEYRFKTKNGRWIWCFSRDSIFARNKDGSVSQLLGTFFDITRLKKFEEKLLKSEKLYRELARNLPNGAAFVVDRDMRYVLAEGQAISKAGMKSSNLEGKTILEALGPELASQYEHNYQSALRGKSFQREHFSHGRHYSTHGGPLYDTVGNIYAALAVSYDITERKLTEKALQESEQRFRIMADGTPIMIWVTDARGNNEFINKAYRRFFGVNSGQVRDQKWHPLIHPDNRESYVASFKQALKDQNPFHAEACVRDVNGEWRWIESYGLPRFSSDGKFCGMVGSSPDITDRKRAEENLRRLNEQLEHKVAERTKKLQTLVGELTLAEQKERQRLAKILHDHLQQLLVGARINSEILCRSFGEKHNKIAQNVFDLINQSIQTSRSLTAELYPPVLQQGLSAVLKWTVRWMSENHGLTIDLQIDPDIEPKQEDITAFLYQSTRELLLNVIKHSGVKSARLEMSCDEEQKQLRVTVSDRGAGFDTGAVLKNEGTGFGLFSIHERLQLMGGTILIESSPGNGASLSLIVPLEAKEEKKNEAIREIKTEHKTTEKGEDRIRVLVVDDHTVVRQGISALLGFHSDIEIVGEADDGQEAVEKARQLHPDVILMDISMPMMDGIQATRIIRSELPFVRIVGLSMHDNQDQADQMIQAGASAYCPKDGSTDELLSAIRRSD
ncbi:MAG: PAS domain S-box protein [Clostridia bacterium]